MRSVSRRLSPFLSDEPPAAKEMTSALCALAARSKLRRVRVLSSKKSVATVKPCRAGTFLMVRVST